MPPGTPTVTAPLLSYDRRGVYLKQTGRTELTPRQQRRWERKLKLEQNRIMGGAA